VRAYPVGRIPAGLVIPKETPYSPIDFEAAGGALVGTVQTLFDSDTIVGMGDLSICFKGLEATVLQSQNPLLCNSVDPTARHNQ